MIEELYTLYYKKLICWCTAMTHDSALAEDLIQETFLRALKNEDLLENLEEVQRKSWLYQTVKHLYVDKVRHAVFESVTDVMPETSREDSEYDFSDSMQLLSKLPDEERILFAMRYLEGYNSTELGEMFSLSSGTVRSRLSSARKHLREELED